MWQATRILMILICLAKSRMVSQRCQITMILRWNVFFFASGTIISYYNHCFFGIFGWQYEIKFHFGVLPWTSGMYGSNIVQMTLNVRLLGTDWAAWPCESRSLFRLRLYYFYMDHGQKRHHGPCRSSPFMGHLYHIKLLNHRIWHRTSPQFSGICHYIYIPKITIG